MKIRIQWEPRDLWVGVFRTPCRHHPRWLVYVCIVPCLPIVIEIPRKTKEDVT